VAETVGGVDGPVLTVSARCVSCPLTGRRPGRAGRGPGSIFRRGWGAITTRITYHYHFGTEHITVLKGTLYFRDRREGGPQQGQGVRSGEFHRESVGAKHSNGSRAMKLPGPYALTLLRSTFFADREVERSLEHRDVLGAKVIVIGDPGGIAPHPRRNMEPGAASSVQDAGRSAGTRRIWPTPLGLTIHSANPFGHTWG